MKLLLLTDDFPMATAEHFPSLEIGALAQAFAEVTVVPTRLTTEARQPVYALPPNVRVVRQVAEELNEKFARGGVLRRVLPGRAGLQTLCEAARHSWRRWLQVANFRARAQLLEDALRRHVRLDDFPIWYSYWSTEAALALVMLRREFPAAKLAARAHGYDLYSERYGGRRLPFQGDILDGVDRLFACSRHGTRYLQTKFPRSSAKVATAYLGIPDARAAARPSDDGVLRLLSCSGVVNVKRVDWIVQALMTIRRPVNWTHFGDGPEFAALTRKAALLPNYVRADLAGQVKHDRVGAHLAGAPVDLFLNTSVSEGLPVGIMEALSYGVPCIAPAVGGIPEALNRGAGMLLPADFTPPLLTRLLEGYDMQNAAPMRRQARAVFREMFWDEKNYAAFAQQLRDLPNTGSQA